MNREELQTSLESKLPFDCSEYRVTAMQALLLDEDVYYTEKTLNSLATQINLRYQAGNKYAIETLSINAFGTYIVIQFADGRLRTVDIEDNKLPWFSLKVRTA